MSFAETITNQGLRFPPKITWADIEIEEHYQFPEYRDLCAYTVLLSFLFFFQHIILKKYLFILLSRFGVVQRNITMPFKHEVLENGYRESTIWSPNRVLQLSKQTDYTEEQILHWLQLKRLQNPTTGLERFSEDGLACLYAIWFFTYHLYVLWDKSWFWNLEHCWLNYPFQDVTRDIWWLYTMNTSFHIANTCLLFLHTKSENSLSTLLHHIITILTFSISWMYNLHRICVSAFLTLSAGTFFLKCATITTFAPLKTATFFLIILCVISWILTTLVIYPVWILHSAIFDSTRLAGVVTLPICLCNGLLLSYLILNIHWSKMLIKRIKKFYTTKQRTK